MSEEKKPSTQEIVEKTTIADVYRAAKQLHTVTKKTALIASPYFSQISQN